MSGLITFLLYFSLYFAIGLELNLYMMRREGTSIASFLQDPYFQQLQLDTEMKLGIPCNWILPMAFILAIIFWPWMVFKIICGVLSGR